MDAIIDPTVADAINQLRDRIANDFIFADKYRAAFEARALAIKKPIHACLYLRFVWGALYNLQGVSDTDAILQSWAQVDITDVYFPYVKIIQDNSEELLRYWLVSCPTMGNFKGLEYVQRLKPADPSANILAYDMPRDVDYLKGIRVRKPDGTLLKRNYPITGKLCIGEWTKDVVFHSADSMVVMDLDLKALLPASLTFDNPDNNLTLWVEILVISIYDPHSSNLRARQATTPYYREMGFYKSCFGLARQ